MCDHIWIMKPFNGTWKWQCYKCGVVVNYITTARVWNEWDSYCDNCPNNSKNGGSGSCNCTLGLTKMKI